MDQTTDQTTTCPCHHCDGQGFIELRDCTGEVQREDTCVFCGGTGTIEGIDHRLNYHLNHCDAEACNTEPIQPVCDA
ncbi:MAG: hypothetical protein EAZ61_00720 [Oscillatoriales cyanobacterium]|nr:MAG: hypothetical protein EAZ61_00720 [Oscillatoriales cyanobacterium]